MPVFISYSHDDKAFVDRLAANLVRARINVWLDRWELKVGDSLIEKIQEGLQDASGLLVILSKKAIASAWCKKELSAGLIRELEERRVVVLPVLLEDCEIPLLLRDKIFADFRSNFDEGWHSVTEAIAGVTSAELGRVNNDSFHTDWAERWGEIDGRFFVQFTLVQASTKWEHTLLTEILIVCTDESTKRYNRYAEAGLDWFGRFVILETIATVTADKPMRVVLDDSFPKSSQLTVFDSKNGLGYEVEVKSQRLGQDTGKDILVDSTGLLKSVHSQVKDRLRRPSRDELQRIKEVVSTH